MLEVRNEFSGLLLSHGITRQEIQRMTDVEFQMTLNALLDENNSLYSQNDTDDPYIDAPLPPAQARQQQRQSHNVNNNRRVPSDSLAGGNGRRRPLTSNRAAFDEDFGNGNIADEEEAIRLAIEKSLDDQLIAPHLRPRPSAQNEVTGGSRYARNASVSQKNNRRNYPPAPNPDPTPLPAPSTTTTRTTATKATAGNYANRNKRILTSTAAAAASNQQQRNRRMAVNDKPDPPGINHIHVTRNPTNTSNTSSTSSTNRRNESVRPGRIATNDKPAHRSNPTTTAAIVPKPVTPTRSKYTPTTSSTATSRHSRNTDTSNNSPDFSDLLIHAGQTNTNQTPRNRTQTTTTAPKANGSRTIISGNDDANQGSARSTRIKRNTESSRNGVNSINAANEIQSQQHHLRAEKAGGDTRSSNSSSSATKSPRFPSNSSSTANTNATNTNAKAKPTAANASGAREDLKSHSATKTFIDNIGTKINEIGRQFEDAEAEILFEEQNMHRNFDHQFDHFDSNEAGFNDDDFYDYGRHQTRPNRQPQHTNEPPPKPPKVQLPQNTKPQNIPQSNIPQNIIPQNQKPVPESKVERDPPQFSESQIIRNIQDMEYVEAQAAAMKKEKEEKLMMQKQEEEKKKVEKEKIRRQKLVEEKFKNLPPEPAKGTSIAIMMPSGNRIVRKFEGTQKGEDVFAWVAGQTIDLPEEQKLFLDSFEIQTMGMQALSLDMNKSLDEQDIKGRICLALSVL